MSKTPNFDAKIQVILDATKPGQRVCELTGEKWMMTDEEIGWYKKFSTPPSKYSPSTRMKLVGGWRTGYEMFWNTAVNTGKPILSYIHPDCPVPVVSDEDWHALDIGSMKEYQQEYAADRPFLEQFIELMKKVPMGARREWKNIKNTIGVGIWNIEDSYLVSSTVDSKRCLYTYYCVEHSEDITTSAFVYSSQNCYGCSRITRCHSCRVVFECQDCINCTFAYDCRNCEYVFGGANLRNKKYIFFGEQLSEKEWKRRVSEVDLSCRSIFDSYQQKFIELIEGAATPQSFNVNAQECTGEYLTDCLRCKDCYYTVGSTDCWYIQGSKLSERCGFVSCAWPAHDCWLSTMLADCTQTKFSNTCGSSSGLEYCNNCHDCEDCFGCSGLKKKRFYIFNKPYSEEEYWALVDAIKTKMLEDGEYGEPLPQIVNPSGMQFSQAALFYGIQGDRVKSLGAPLFDADKGTVLPGAQQNVKPAKIEDVPECIALVDETWAGKPFFDELEKRRWSVVPQELSVYKSLGLPFPNRHRSVRLRELISVMNTPEQETVLCASCRKETATAKNRTFPNRKVYCQPCYLKHLEQS